MPYTTVQKKLRGAGSIWLDDIMTSAVSLAAAKPAIAEISSLLRERHHIRPGGQDDFNIRHPEEVIKAQIAANRTLTFFLISGASISLPSPRHRVRDYRTSPKHYGRRRLLHYEGMGEITPCGTPNESYGWSPLSASPFSCSSLRILPERMPHLLRWVNFRRRLGLKVGHFARRLTIRSAIYQPSVFFHGDDRRRIIAAAYKPIMKINWTDSARLCLTSH